MGITSTTEVEACSAIGDGSCQSCGDSAILDDDDTDDDDDGDDDDDDYESTLEKRWSKVGQKEKNVGNCISRPGLADIQFPEYPSGGDISKNEAKIAAASPASPLAQVSRWWWSERVGCVYTLKGPDTRAVYHGGRAFRRLIANQKPNTDHIFEKSFLRNFLSSITDMGATKVHSTTGAAVGQISCDDLEYYANDGSGSGWLQAVYDTYPGAQQNAADIVQPLSHQFMSGFMGVDGFTNNDAKGYATNPTDVRSSTTKLNSAGKVAQSTTPWTETSSGISGKLLFLEKLALAVDLMNQASAQTAMDEQNNRIWSRL